MKTAVEIADEGDAAAGGKHRGQEWRTLLEGPGFRHVLGVVGDELAHVPVRAGHEIEYLRCRGAATAQFDVHIMAAHQHAALAERNDQKIGWRIVAGGLPVVAAFRAWAGRDPLIGLLVQDVLAIGDLAGLGIDLAEDVLEQGLLFAQELAGDAVELPQDAILADGHQRLLIAMIDQHALEDFVEIQRFARHMLEIPFELAGIGIERQGRTGVERRGAIRSCGWRASRAWPGPRPNRSC